MDFNSLRRDAIDFNQHYISFESPDAFTLKIHSHHSLFRLGVWLEGYIACYNTVYTTYRLDIKSRSKYCIVLESNH